MQPIEAADFHDLDQVATPRLSPDGDRVAYVHRSPDGDEEYAATIRVVDVDGGEPRRFTLAEGVDAEPRWSPSGDRLAFTSTRGADDDRQQLWVLPTDGGEARQVTDVVGGVSRPRWSPDGERIAFVQGVSDEDREEDRDLDVPEEFEPDAPDPRVIDRTVYRTGERYLDGKRSQVYLVDTADDTVERVTTADQDHASPSWGDAGTLYFAADADVPDPDDTLEADICRYDLESEAVERLHTTTAFETALTATSDDRVAFTYTDPDRGTIGQTELRLLDAERGDVVELTADLDRTLDYGATPHWGPGEESLYFSTPDEGATAVWRLDAPAVDAVSEPERLVRDDWSSISAAHVGDGAVAFVQSGWDHPGDLFVFADGKRRRLTECNAAYLDEHAVAEPEELRYSAGDDGQAGDAELQGWLLTPPEGEGKHPLVVEVHGGPHAMWTTSGTMWHEFQTLAARGYAVFWSNPRGSAGYGEEFMSAIERDWGDVTTNDVLAGVEAATDREEIDGDQLFLTGGSFGGYMTAWLVGHTDRFEAAASQRGVYDLAGFYGSTDWAYKLVEDEFGTTPWEDAAFLHEHSPTAHADEVETPTLVLHSDDDYRTPACTAELFHRILRKHGVDTRMVRYPDEGHELSRSGQPGHVVDRIERIARWFDGYSEYHGAERALDRDPDAGLTAAEDEADDES
jgi:dipeptidyl aminopeptidase/acylaminoacyl peptidase